MKHVNDQSSCFVYAFSQYTPKRHHLSLPFPKLIYKRGESSTVWTLSKNRLELSIWWNEAAVCTITGHSFPPPLSPSINRACVPNILLVEANYYICKVRVAKISRRLALVNFFFPLTPRLKTSLCFITRALTNVYTIYKHGSDKNRAIGYLSSY